MQAGYSTPTGDQARIHPTPPPFTLALGRPLPQDFFQRILHHLDNTARQQLAVSSKSWYEQIKGRTFIPHFLKIQGTHDQYLIKHHIDRQEAAAILQQTGLDLFFKPGQTVLYDYILGSGAFGIVRIGYACQKKEYVGIKITEAGFTSKDRSSEARIQEILKDLPFIMPVLDACRGVNSENKHQFYQVMPLAGIGSVETISQLLTQADPAFRNQVLFNIAEGFLQAVAGMHAQRYVHLDLKPSNLVVDHLGTPLLIDFGCAKAIPSSGTISVIMIQGYCPYFAPEVLLERHIRGAYEGKCNATKVDAWAAGLTLLSLAQGGAFSFPTDEEIESFIRKAELNNPFLNNVYQQLDSYFSQYLAKIPELTHASKDSYWAVIQGLLKADPNDRLGVDQALQQPWFVNQRKSSKTWMEKTRQYLREMVQSLQREDRGKLTANNQSLLSSYSQTTSSIALSPQDLPHDHPTGFVQRLSLQAALQKRLLEMLTTPVAVTVCQGMGGVGKTQLVSYLLHHNAVQDHFGLRLWFQSADRKELLDLQYLLLARELRLVDDKASIDEVLPKVRAYLAAYPMRLGKPWLAVYDNAEDFASLQPYLPAQGGHALITTRTITWPEEHILQVDVLTAEEAQTLVDKLLMISDPQIDLLCQELGCLPLGIAQACAYMRCQQLAASQYIEKLRQTPQLLAEDRRLLGKKLPSSLMALWQVTLKTLQEEYPEVRTLLNAVAYLAPDPIPRILLDKIASSKASDMAIRYAFLQKSKGGFAMHRLVQQVLRLQATSDEQEAALHSALTAFNEAYVTRYTDISFLRRNRQLLPHFERVVACCEAVHPFPTTLELPFARALHCLGLLKGELGQPYLAKDLLEKALVLMQKMNGSESTDIATTLNNLGLAWRDLDDAQKAIGYLEHALAILEKTYGPEHPNITATINNLGLAWRDLGDAQKAIGYLERVLAIRKKIYGPEHPDVANTLNGLGVAWRDLGETPKAIGYYKRALAIREKIYGPEHPRVATTLNNLGVAWRDLGDTPKAISYHERALTIYEKIYGSEHPDVATTLSGLGLAWQALGDAQKANNYFERANSIVKILNTTRR